MTLKGPRFVLTQSSTAYPAALRRLLLPPERLFVVGYEEALTPGLAVIGARRATSYGRGCARRFARLAAEKGVVIISGGARGCDSEAHRSAVEAGGRTVAFLGGGCDCMYPAENEALFQSIIDAGGAVASEYPWDTHPMPFMFRARNRLIAGLADAVLIVEAGIPSGTFSTADEALEAGKEVLVVPGAITSAASSGSNRLLFQGATPVVDDESFEDALFRACGALMRPNPETLAGDTGNAILEAIVAQPLDSDSLLSLAMREYGVEQGRTKLMEALAEGEMRGIIARQSDGKWGPVVRG